MKVLNSGKTAVILSDQERFFDLVTVNNAFLQPFKIALSLLRSHWQFRWDQKRYFSVLNVVFENTAKILNQFSKFMTWKTCNPETKILYQTGSFKKFKEICLLNHFKSTQLYLNCYSIFKAIKGKNTRYNLYGIRQLRGKTRCLIIGYQI